MQLAAIHACKALGAIFFLLIVVPCFAETASSKDYKRASESIGISAEFDTQNVPPSIHKSNFHQDFVASAIQLLNRHYPYLSLVNLHDKNEADSPYGHEIAFVFVGFYDPITGEEVDLNGIRIYVEGYDFHDKRLPVFETRKTPVLPLGSGYSRTNSKRFTKSLNRALFSPRSDWTYWNQVSDFLQKKFFSNIPVSNTVHFFDESENLLEVEFAENSPLPGGNPWLRINLPSDHAVTTSTNSSRTSWKIKAKNPRQDGLLVQADFTNNDTEMTSHTDNGDIVQTNATLIRKNRPERNRFAEEGDAAVYIEFYENNFNISIHSCANVLTTDDGKALGYPDRASCTK